MIGFIYLLLIIVYPIVSLQITHNCGTYMKKCYKDFDLCCEKLYCTKYHPGTRYDGNYYCKYINPEDQEENESIPPSMGQYDGQEGEEEFQTKNNGPMIPELDAGVMDSEQGLEDAYQSVWDRKPRLSRPSNRNKQFRRHFIWLG